MLSEQMALLIVDVSGLRGTGPIGMPPHTLTVEVIGIAAGGRTVGITVNNGDSVLIPIIECTVTDIVKTYRL